MFHSIIFLINYLVFLIFLFWWNSYLFSISRIFFRERFWFQNYLAILFSINSLLLQLFYGFLFGSSFCSIWCCFFWQYPIFFNFNKFLIIYLVNLFSYLFDRSLANDSNPYSLTYFLVLGCVVKRIISIYQ